MLLNSWLHGIINTKPTLHGQLYEYGFATLVCLAKWKYSLTLQRFSWWKLVSSLLKNANGTWCLCINLNAYVAEVSFFLNILQVCMLYISVWNNDILCKQWKSGLYAFFFIVFCPSLASPSNGMISCSLGGDGVPTPGDTCNFTCDSGYELIINDTRTCQNNGSWSDRDATCRRGERY